MRMMLGLVLACTVVHGAHAEVVGWLPSGEPIPSGFTVFEGARGSILVGSDDRILPTSAWPLTSARDAYLVLTTDLPAGAVGVLHRDDRLSVVVPPDARAAWFEGIAHKQILRTLPQRRTPPPALRRAKPVDPAVKAAIVAAVDVERFSTLVRELSGDLTTQVDGETVTLDHRYTHRADHQVAADWIEERFSALGYATEQQEFQVGNSPTQNVVAHKVGTNPDEIVLVGGHYDSICFQCNPLQDPTPGAEDNATGVAATLHLAEILASYPTERSIVFIAFGGEEQGLWGSTDYASSLGADLEKVVAAVTMDMISYRSSLNSIDVEGFDGTENGGNAADSRGLMDLILANVAATVPAMATTTLIPGFGSDHRPLAYAGIPAVLIIESEYDTYPHYHRSTDIYDEIDPDFGADVVHVLAATVADLAVPSASEGCNCTSPWAAFRRH